MSVSSMIWLHDLIRDKPARDIAIIDHDGTQLDYGTMRDMTDALAGALRDHGVRAGDRVLLVSENCAAYAIAILAASQIGAWISPVNARQSVDELTSIAAHCQPRCVLFTARASEAAADHAAGFGAAPLGIDAPDSGRPPLARELHATPAADVAVEPTSDDPAERVAALLYTTGTTSAPKGVMLTHANLMWNAATSAGLRRMTPQDDVLGVLPGTHIFGFSSVFLAAMYAGARLRFLPRFTPESVLTAFAEGASIMPAVPQMYARILRHLDAGGQPFKAPRLRYISAGGAPLDPAWKTRTEQIFGLPLNNGYGLTEASPSVSGTRPDAPRRDLSCGPAFDGVDMWIDRPDAEGVGELLIRSPGVMKGYYRNPEATAEVLSPDGTFRCGDLARIDGDGCLHIVGRLKELIIRSGFNVYPPEIEAMLTRHPRVSQAAVVGRPRGGDEEILAFVMPGGDGPTAGTDPELTPDDLRDWLSQRLVGYKVPQQILLVDELPTAATGKILKHRLIGHFAVRLDQTDTPPRQPRTAPSQRGQND